MIAAVLALAVAASPQSSPLTAEETREFMKRLAKVVEDHHLKKIPGSEQRGMVYEYFDVERKGQHDQWVQGEALDTMHDGAWFAAALVNASRATDDPYYKNLLTRWVLPFYCKMLNESDTLFSAKRDDVHAKGNRFGREHQLQEGEKGFVPYWWDDGASVSLERRRTKNGQPDFSATDRRTGSANPTFALDGWSHGSSNHMAQDLGVMLQLAWLLLKDGEVARAAKYLQECRARHGAAAIPAVLAAAGLSSGDAALLKRIPEHRDGAPRNHYTACLAPADPSKTVATPAFADDSQYDYYAGIARAGGSLPRPLAFKLVYDAYTHPMLFRYYSDNADVPPGVNRFDLHPLPYKEGKPTTYRSTKAVPTGSRFGPQNMIVCGWALQALKAYPGIWEERVSKDDHRVRFDRPSDPVVLGGLSVRLESSRSALTIQGATKAEKAAFRIHSQPEGKGSWAEVTVEGGAVRAVNDAGREVRIESKVDGPTFRVTIPYTVAKDQTPWANGLEHFRYTIAAGGASRNFTLVSGEEQVRAALLRELGEGLRTWRAVLDEKGYIPTGDGPSWSRFSDSGGYAHLLSAAAQWLLVLDGKRDWELHR
jgi:hypothetical protein